MALCLQGSLVWLGSLRPQTRALTPGLQVVQCSHLPNSNTSMPSSQSQTQEAPLATLEEHECLTQEHEVDLKRHILETRGLELEYRS